MLLQALLSVKVSGLDFGSLASFIRQFWDVKRQHEAAKRLENSVQLRITYPLAEMSHPTARLKMPIELEALLGTLPTKSKKFPTLALSLENLVLALNAVSLQLSHNSIKSNIAKISKVKESMEWLIVIFMQLPKEDS